MESTDQNNNTNSNSNSNVAVKLVLGDHIRVVRLKNSSAYPQLVKQVEHLFEVQAPSFTYVDSDNDSVSVDSKLELNTAFDLCPKGKTLRLNIVKKSTIDDSKSNFHRLIKKKQMRMMKLKQKATAKANATEKNKDAKKGGFPYRPQMLQIIALGFKRRVLIKRLLKQNKGDVAATVVALSAIRARQGGVDSTDAPKIVNESSSEESSESNSTSESDGVVNMSTSEEDSESSISDSDSGNVSAKTKTPFQYKEEFKSLKKMGLRGRKHLIKRLLIAYDGDTAAVLANASRFPVFKKFAKSTDDQFQADKVTYAKQLSALQKAGFNRVPVLISLLAARKGDVEMVKDDLKHLPAFRRNFWGPDGINKNKSGNNVDAKPAKKQFGHKIQYARENYREQFDTLMAMGFKCKGLLWKLLAEHDGDLDEVIAELSSHPRFNKMFAMQQHPIVAPQSGCFQRRGPPKWARHQHHCLPVWSQGHRHAHGHGRFGFRGFMRNRDNTVDE